jgi:cell division protein FtsL
MKILLVILILLVVVASVFADYKWRQWMVARRRERQ